METPRSGCQLEMTALVWEVLVQAAAQSMTRSSRLSGTTFTRTVWPGRALERWSGAPTP